MKINFKDRICEYKKIIFHPYQLKHEYDIEFKEDKNDILLVFSDNPYYLSVIREQIQNGYLDMISVGGMLDIDWRFIT